MSLSKFLKKSEWNLKKKVKENTPKEYYQK